MMITIENLPANSRLCISGREGLSILGEENGQRVAYNFTQRGDLLNSEITVSKVSSAYGYSEIHFPTWTQIRDERFGLIDQLVERGKIDKEFQPELWQWMNPQIDECYISGINAITRSKDQCELASFIINAKQDDGRRLACIKHYPIQYWALLLSELKAHGQFMNGSYWGGEISTIHLAKILGVKKLTAGMKKFIRLVRPNSIVGYRDLISSCLSKWDVLCPKFSHISKEVNESTVQSFINNIAEFPSLLQAKWYTADLIVGGTFLYRYQYEIREALRYVQAISDTSVSVEHFLVRYVRSAAHLEEIIICADAYFALNADSYCKELYPDDLAFPEPILDFENLDVERLPFKHINTVGELRRCARMLDNCSVSYIEDVLKGESYLYLYESANSTEFGMLEIRSAGVRAMINRGTTPEWQDFKDGSIIRQFVGHKNCKMSDDACHWLKLGIQASVVGKIEKIPNFPLGV